MFLTTQTQFLFCFFYTGQHTASNCLLKQKEQNIYHRNDIYVALLPSFHFLYRVLIVVIDACLFDIHMMVMFLLFLDVIRGCSSGAEMDDHTCDDDYCNHGVSASTGYSFLIVTTLYNLVV